MMNTVMLVGRLAQDVEVKKLDSGKEVTRVTLAVNRSFKNPDGIYEVDYIDCILWDGLAKNISEYCHKGDTVGIRGRIQVSTYEKDEIKRKSVEVVCEKLTFLSTTASKEDGEIREKRATYKKSTSKKEKAE